MKPYTFKGFILLGQRLDDINTPTQNEYCLLFTEDIRKIYVDPIIFV